MSADENDTPTEFDRTAAPARSASREERGGEHLDPELDEATDSTLDPAESDLDARKQVPSGEKVDETGNPLTLEVREVSGATLDLHLRIASLEAQIAQRDEAISKLSSRLCQLEQGLAVEHVADQQELEEVRDEIGALRSTRIFRYSAGLRRLYRSLRRLGGRPSQEAGPQ